MTFADAVPPERTEPDRGLNSTEKSKGEGGVQAEMVRVNLVVREIVPSEPVTATTCVPVGALEEVTRMSSGEQVGRHAAGVNEQPVPDGSSTHENWTLRADPDVTVTVTVVVEEFPLTTGPESGWTDNEKSKADWAVGVLIHVTAKDSPVATANAKRTRTMSLAKVQAGEGCCPFASLTSDAAQAEDGTRGARLQLKS